MISYAPKEVAIEHLQFYLPSGLAQLQTNHRKYLRGRGFDPDILEHDWGLLGSGPISLLDKIDYRFRIIIPFVWDGVTVSFDSRDITEKHTSKYMACPKNRELIPHKSILYGKQEHWSDVGICVEGPTDVWRFGTSAFATSGIKYTPSQVRVMAKLFKKIWICFDANESQAHESAKSLRGDLRFRGVDAQLADFGTDDPGSMSQEDADKFVKSLL
jgi:DNA primase